MVRPFLRARATIVAALFSAFLAPATLAADMPYPVEAPPLPADEPVEWGSNWYLRGQVGAADQNISTIDGMRLQTSWPSNWTVGLGGGFQFNQWFRADITVDYQKLWRRDGLQVAMYCFSPVASVCTSSVDNRAESISFLANAYLDLGNWWGFTPYIGAGIGANLLIQDANVQWAPALWPYDVTIFHSHDRVNFSYAAMAGVSYDIDEHWKVDLGYRWINLGRIDGYDIYNRYISRDLLSNQLRLGFRYVID
jgi:opacity protein-like surface antigen